MKQQSLLDKRIPNLLALLLIIAGVGLTTIITGTRAILQNGAAPSETPQNVRIDNITDTSFTVSYTTAASVIGSLSFGRDSKLGILILDDRDQTTNTPRAYTTHIMTIKNLIPNTKYYFSVLSGAKTYINGSSPFTATTGPPLQGSKSSPQLISGTVTLPAINTGSGVLVYAQIPGGESLATLSDLEGNYRLSLVNIRTLDLQQYASVKNTDIISLTFTDGTAMSHVTITLVNMPMPTIVLSQDYDFAMTKEPTSPPQHETANFPLFSTQGVTAPTIQTPQKNQNFTDQQPEFSGTAKPNSQVTILIHSTQVIQTQVTTDNNGQWTFRPETPLVSGDHTITITAIDNNGKRQTITQSFTILPLGSQVFDTATPSATLTLTPTPAITNTPVPTETPTTTTQITPPATSPTATPTSLPTATPPVTLTPTETPLPTATPPLSPTAFIPTPTHAPLPSTGNGSIFTIGIASILTTIVGIGLFLLTRGGTEI